MGSISPIQGQERRGSRQRSVGHAIRTRAGEASRPTRQSRPARQERPLVDEEGK